MLTSRQRVLNALAYTGCDRLPTFYQATPEFDAELKQHLDIVAATTRWTPSSAST